MIRNFDKDEKVRKPNFLSVYVSVELTTALVILILEKSIIKSFV